MNIWVVLWFFVAVGLMGFFVWTTYILFQQKKAWKQFADKNKLRYEDGETLLESPKITGSYEGYTISAFTGEHLGANRRTTRKLTAIEISLTSPIIFEGGVAAGQGMTDFMKDMNFPEEVRIDHKKWKTDYMAVTNSPNALSKYLTQERLDALFKLITIKNAWVILIFKADTALLRLDTPSALESPKKIKAYIKRMIDVAKELELKAGESKVLKEAAIRSSSRTPELRIDDDVLEKTDLILEDDDSEDGVKKEAKSKPKTSGKKKPESKKT